MIFRMKNVGNVSYGENHNTRFIFSIFFLQSSLFQRMVETNREATDGSTFRHRENGCCMWGS
jgi:hypothetical protein